MESLVIILPGIIDHNCEGKHLYVSKDYAKQVFDQCKKGFKFKFENDFLIPDSERLFRFKYAKVGVDEELQEVALWNASGVVILFEVRHE